MNKVSCRTITDRAVIVKSLDKNRLATFLASDFLQILTVKDLKINHLKLKIVSLLKKEKKKV